MKQFNFKCGFNNARLLFALMCFTSIGLNAQNTKKPNVLIIWGDDIGTTNVSAYSDGLMGYTTPNIDRVGNEGLRFFSLLKQKEKKTGKNSFS